MGFLIVLDIVLLDFWTENKANVHQLVINIRSKVNFQIAHFAFKDLLWILVSILHRWFEVWYDKKHLELLYNCFTHLTISSFFVCLFRIRLTQYVNRLIFCIHVVILHMLKILWIRLHILHHNFCNLHLERLVHFIPFLIHLIVLDL